MPQGQSTAPGAWGVRHPRGARGAELRKTTNAQGQSQSQWVAGGPKQPSTETKVARRAAQSIGGTALGLWPVSHSTARLTANGSSNPQTHLPHPQNGKQRPASLLCCNHRPLPAWAQEEERQGHAWALGQPPQLQDTSCPLCPQPHLWAPSRVKDSL